MIKAIVFDCFGVLVGSNYWDVYRGGGGDPDKDADFLHDIMSKADAGALPGSELRRMTAERLGITPEQFNANLLRLELPDEQLLEYIRTELKPYYKLAMLSNAEPGAPQRYLKPEQLALMDAVIVSGEVGCEKPQREIFQIAADRLGVSFDEMLFVDDLARYVDPARAMGIESIQYIDLDDLKRQLADHLKEPAS